MVKRLGRRVGEMFWTGPSERITDCTENKKRARAKKKLKASKRKRRKLQRAAKIKDYTSNLEFYQSDEWLKARYQALKRSKGYCECCGERGYPDNPLHVDHIKPRSKHPALALMVSNLQVLCKACNFGKGAWDETDWRERKA